MGFPWEACRKAVHFTGNTGSEAAMNWVMEHMGDADFAEPLVIQSKSSGVCVCVVRYCGMLDREDVGTSSYLLRCGSDQMIMTV